MVFWEGGWELVEVWKGTLYGDEWHVGIECVMMNREVSQKMESGAVMNGKERSLLLWLASRASLANEP